MHPALAADGVQVRRADLRDCLRCYPFADALAVADSALRAGCRAA